MGLFDPETPVLLAIGLILSVAGALLSGVFLVLRDARGSFGNRLVAILGTSACASILHTALVGVGDVEAYSLIDGLELTAALRAPRAHRSDARYPA